MAPRRRRRPRPRPRGRRRSSPGTASWSRGHAGASLLLKHGAGRGAAPRRCQQDGAAAGLAWTFLAETYYHLLARAAVLGARRGGASPTTRAAAHEDQGPSQREREREGEGEGRPEAELPGLVGALPRELKRNAPSRFCLVFLRCERERRGVISSPVAQAQPASRVSDFFVVSLKCSIIIFLALRFFFLSFFSDHKYK